MRVLLETLAFLLVAGLCLAVSSAQAVMLVHYPFDGDTTSVTNVAPGGGFDGTLVGTAQVVYDAERDSDVLELDGVDLDETSSSVTITEEEFLYELDLSVTGEATFAAWIYRERLGAPHSCIFSQGHWTGAPYFGLFPEYTEGGGDLVAAGPGIAHSGAGTIPVNEWIHVATTMYSTYAAFYVNGEEVAVDVDRGGAVMAPEELSIVGMEQYSTGRWVFDGHMDDFRIYDHVLTEEEIADLAGVVVNPPPGDATRDGKVDDADAVVLATNWGDGTELDPATWDEGNFDGDWIVGPMDAAIMAANWGHGVESEGAPIPEPSVLLLLLAGLASIAAVRRTR